MTAAFHPVERGRVDFMGRAVGVDLQVVPCPARCALDGAAQPLAERIVGNRLQHIVQRIHRIALDGILRRVCDEDDDDLGVLLRISSAAIMPSMNFISISIRIMS